MDRILIILKKENGPRASSAPALGLNTIIFKHIYWYMQQTQVSVYRTIGPLVVYCFVIFHTWSHSSFSEKLASLQKTPQGSPPSSNEEFFFTPPASMVEMSPAAGAGTGAGGQVIDRRPPANVNFNEAIEQIQMRKAQEQMSIDGHEHVMLLKVSLSYFAWRLVFGFLTKSNRNRAVLP